MTTEKGNVFFRGLALPSWQVLSYKGASLALSEVTRSQLSLKRFYHLFQRPSFGFQRIFWRSQFLKSLNNLSHLIIDAAVQILSPKMSRKTLIKSNEGPR